VQPPLATKQDIDFLWEHLDQIDFIASDHAPHTRKEKRSINPPAGIPGLETLLPLLLTEVNKRRISIEEIIRLTNTNPQKIFGLKQRQETYLEADLEERYIIEDRNLKTKCGWSPFAGREAVGKVKSVFIRGIKVFENGQILVSPGFGKNIG
jgi:carbamoyl-phosphate synthase/aspartate carbamoyltransferase/dihydroorotase